MAFEFVHVDTYPRYLQICCESLVLEKRMRIDLSCTTTMPTNVVASNSSANDSVCPRTRACSVRARFERTLESSSLDPTTSWPSNAIDIDYCDCPFRRSRPHHRLRWTLPLLRRVRHRDLQDRRHCRCQNFDHLDVACNFQTLLVFETKNRLFLITYILEIKCIDCTRFLNIYFKFLYLNITKMIYLIFDL